MTERSGGRGPKSGARSNSGPGKRTGGGSRRSDSRGGRDSRGRSDSRGSRDSRGSGDSRGSRDSRGGERGKGQQGSRSRSGRPDSRGSRDDRGGRGGSSRDDRGGRSRDDRGGRSRDDRGGRSRDDRGGRSGGPRTRRGKYNDAAPPEAGSKSWGGLARQGAARLHNDPWDEPGGRGDGRDDVSVPGEEEYERTPEEQEKYEARMAKREAGERNRERLRNEAQAAIARSGSKTGPAKKGPVAARDRPALVPRKIPDPKRHLIELLGESHGKRAWRDLNVAAEHLDAGRTGSAKPIMNRLYKQASEVVEVSETYGLTMYALGNWYDAIEVLEDVRIRTGQPDQNPVLADAHRAVGQWADVTELWEELRDLSPASELVVEGRIVAAGALADQGELNSAVRLLAKGWKRPKRPQEHHLRRAYALADLYERAGESPRAKELFGWVAHHEPGFVDAKQRAK